MMTEIAEGLYERLLDEDLKALLDANPELKPVLRAIDDEAAPQAYAQFISQIIYKGLRIAKKTERVRVLNGLIELLSATDGLEFIQRNRLLKDEKNFLMELSRTGIRQPRPETPLGISSLLTGHGMDPPLEHELRAEMMTADRVDILVSFIKWSGLRLLMPAFERLQEKGVSVRILSTSYMGASDPAALEWLSNQPNVDVKVSFDTGRTRLHAKAYQFFRRTGFSTAYIGSANMSHSAMTQGLEWTVKVTAQDMPHILDRFVAEFSSYWESAEFEPLLAANFDRFRKSIQSFRNRSDAGIPFFAEITAHPFQARILEALEAVRQNGSYRNLVVAATGTGKTVVSALDYKRIAESSKGKPSLLFVVHRKEILEQALGCFRTVLRDPNFGELLVDGEVPSGWQHVFASVQSLNNRQPWRELGAAHFKFVVLDEAHHGMASSYRPLFDMLKPDILLGLTATPERMDGSSILPDFDNRFAAEIRLPEALEEKLLCPFHYFGVTDSVDLNEERFWRNGRYDAGALESVYTGDDFRARARVDTILQALKRYQPELDDTKGIGFCAGVKHADFMARHFNEAGISSAVLLGKTAKDERSQRLREFREGKLTFLFTVDVLSEGVDIPDINLVLFLRPTDSLTVFLQQLGRGLRHAPGKDCLTVLDFVSQTHQKYRLDTKFAALLSRRRLRIDREMESDFPHLPPGCSIQLERVAREYILKKIKAALSDLNNFVRESLLTWDRDVGKPLNFGNFIEETGLSPIEILRKRSWSQWKALANQLPMPADADLENGRKALARIALRTDPSLLQSIEQLQDPKSKIEAQSGIALHYLLWGKKAEAIGVRSVEESLQKWNNNSSLVEDSVEIAQWRRSNPTIPVNSIKLPFESNLQLHAAYGSAEIKAYLGLASLNQSGPTGQGVLHVKSKRSYIHLVTFRKSEQDFSPTTLYQDYPISRKRIHWESQSTISQSSATGQNYFHFKDRGYTILFFARLEKRIEGETAPFIFLGPAKDLLSFEGDRPIRMVWDLEYLIPAALFEDARAV